VGVVIKEDLMDKGLEEDLMDKGLEEDLMDKGLEEVGWGVKIQIVQYL
jgi:hypothetical protein